MSVAKKIINLAKANLNALLERAAETVDPRRKLSNIPDAELEAELARRRSARVTEEKVADAKARIDGPGARAPKDREERKRIAREREARVRAARDARDKAQAQAQKAQQERARTYQQQHQSSRTNAGSARSGGTSAGSGGGAGRSGKDPMLARYYNRLEVPYGSDFDTVKGAYRKLMKKYRPDLHANKGPEKQRAAHEVSQALTQAYNEIEKHLLGGPNRAR